MKSKFDGYNWIVRLQKGERLIESLTKLVETESIPTCWVNVIGGASSVTLKFYNMEKKEYESHNVNEDLEITGIQGNLAWLDDKPVFHLHGTFSKSDLSVIGGHVEDLVVSGTCEVFLHKWYGENITRSHDDEVGLTLLDL